MCGRMEGRRALTRVEAADEQGAGWQQQMHVADTGRRGRAAADSAHPGRRDRQYLLQLFLKCTAASQRAEWSASLLARISCGRVAWVAGVGRTVVAAAAWRLGAGDRQGGATDDPACSRLLPTRQAPHAHAHGPHMAGCLPARTARQEQKPGRASSSRSAASACFWVLGSWLSAECRQSKTAGRSCGPSAAMAASALHVRGARGCEVGGGGVAAPRPAALARSPGGSG